MVKISKQLEELKTVIRNMEQEHRQMISLLLSALCEHGMIIETVQGDQRIYTIVKDQNEK
jgi:hypothetical protein